MSFGKRIALPASSSRMEERTVRVRQGGYPLAVLTVAVVSYLCVLLMAFVPYFNPTSRSFAEIAAVSVMAVLNVAVVAAIVILLVDMAFRAMKFSAVWAYGGASGLLTFALCFWLASALGRGPAPTSAAFVAMIVLVPTMVGGCVLGFFRR